LKFALAADHAGFQLKEDLGKDLQAMGHEVLDLGTHDPSMPSDYPDSADAAGTALVERKAERGIIVCGSGVGVCIAANKFPGVRAGVCHDTYSARQGVEHDDMNVLCLGQRIIGTELAREVVRAFAAARFSGEDRHVRRLEKLKAIEKRFLR
jgi:ribose 5-phosphate isomerase B